MKRLTRRSNVGEGLPASHLNLMVMDTTSQDTLTEILELLAAYEDTGLSPEEIETAKSAAKLFYKDFPKNVGKATDMLPTALFNADLKTD
ncbi:hypothetical protein SAMN05443270_3101 [Lacrimispora sphenoides]|uniref:hypothetical protein n=1 Tax=Lacrimispora sphenoides TaxID=29370 RepID=UPI0008AE7833|nr:hypothetical protein [Lacrimispora sphenoides]SEU09521.1 hypothetical protein SAMN05443270_3101 [Lacrimispora sphenoides]